MIYGNVRAENILIKFDKDQKSIEQVKFINFGSLISIDNASQMIIADRVDHFPPDVLKHFLEMQKFSPQSSDESSSSDSKFRASYASFDAFSLGVLVMQIIAGCPMQMALPLKMKCKRRDGEVYQARAPFGQSSHTINELVVSQLIEAQEKQISKLSQFIVENDRYGFAQDPDLLPFLQKLLQFGNAFVRTDANDILNDKFIKKYI